MTPDPDAVRIASQALAAAPSRDAILMRWGLRYDEVRAAQVGLHQQALWIPFYDANGNVTGVKGRTLAGSHEDASRYFWATKGRAPALWLPPGGLDGDPVVISEGPLKSLALAVILGRPVGALASGVQVGIPREGRAALQGRPVWYVADPDEEGSRGPAILAKQLRGIASQLKAVPFPPPGWGLNGQRAGDPNDLLRLIREGYGGRAAEVLPGIRAQLEAALGAAPDLLEKVAAPRSRTDGARRLAVQVKHSLSDLGNAKRLAARHGQDLRYCHPWGAWLVWDGRRWRRDATGEAVRRAKDVVASIYLEAAAEPDEEYRQFVGLHAFRSEAAARIRAMIDLAQSESGIPVEPGDLDRDGWLFNAENGTLDLRTGQLRPHRREDLITMLAPVAYDPDARAPTWEAFLHRVLAGQKELVLFMEKAAGYALSGDVREQVLFFLHGPGANGKTTFINAILKTVADYGKVAAPDLLTAKHLEQHPTGLADLRGCRFVASVEVEEGRRLAEVLVKQLTGADRLKARMMRQDFFEFEPTHKIFLVANHKPTIRGTDLAIWRRILLVPFDVLIPKPEQDKALPAKLEGERAGILAWLVRGCRLWQREGLDPPAEVMAATKQYRDESDIIRDFLEDRCALDPAFWTSSKDLRTAYMAWCEKAGEKPISQKMFGGRLKERGLTDQKGTGGTRGWEGIGIVADGG